MSRNGASDQRRGGRGTVEAHKRRRMRPTVMALEDRRLLSTFTVTNTADSGTGSLRYEVGQANRTPGPDTIDFSNSVFNTPQTITLISGQLALTNRATTTIDGPGAGLLSVSGNNTSQVFYIQGGSAALSGLTITAGKTSGNGGGLYNFGGTTTLTNCTVSGNSAGRNGGGLANAGGTTTLTNCTVGGNSATFGGGLFNSRGTTTLTNSTVSGNSASYRGGGLFNFIGTTTLTNCTVSGNSAVSAGGGLLNYATTTLTNCTVSGNSAGSGGGLANYSSGTTKLTNTIVAGQTAGGDIGGPGAVSGSNNLIGTGGSGGLINGVKGNIVGVANPGLDPNGLQNNGGPTQTIALLAGSPAIDGGSSSISGVAVPITDQRGALRGPAGLNAGSAVDIGAYEASSSYLVTNTADSSDVGTLRAAVGWANVSTNANPANIASPAPNTVVFDTSGAFATPQTITLSPSLGALELSNTSTAESIDGPGASVVTVSGNNAVQVFNVASGVTASLSGLAVSGGTAFQGGGIYNAGTTTITGCFIEDNYAGFYYGGGGIANIGGTMTVNDSAIDSNNAGGAAGIFSYGAMTIADSTVADNNAVCCGGGGIIDGYGDVPGMMTITDSNVISNHAAGGAGGIGGGGGGIGVDADSTLTVVNSTIADNTDGIGYGGGIADLATTTVINSTIVGNSAAGGAGIFSYPDYPGNSGTLTVVNSTIAENIVSSGGIGGGLEVYPGPVTLNNTIVALNTDGTGSGATPDDIALSGGVVSSTSAYNLIGTGGSGLVNGVNGNQVGVANPGLDPNGLQNNGGPTQTIALLPGSPAIDAGSNALAVDPTTGQPLAYDQRGPGFPRIVNGTVDIGAFEVQNNHLAVKTQPPGSVTAGASFGLTVTADDGAQTPRLSDTGFQSATRGGVPGSSTPQRKTRHMKGPPLGLIRPTAPLAARIKTKSKTKLKRF